MRIAIFPLARTTFDTAYAQDKATAAWNHLSPFGDCAGDPTLLTELSKLNEALETRLHPQPDLVVVLQASFCDASFVHAINKAITPAMPLAIWAFPEPRTGERLRLNAFCGLNLACHALKQADRTPRVLYTDPKHPRPTLKRLFSDSTKNWRLEAPHVHKGHLPKVRATLKHLRNRNMGVIGTAPDGFTTCAYDAKFIWSAFSLRIEECPVDHLFQAARLIDATRVEKTYHDQQKLLMDMPSLEDEACEKSIRLHAALSDTSQNWIGAAVRCWPETFTQYGAAVCGAMGALNDKGIPSGCEADVWGVITAWFLQRFAGDSPWLVDVVDIDDATNSSVLWHCGSAPMCMCGAQTPPRATIHSNRQKPLLREFALKPGPVTFARLSTARNKLTLVVGRGTILEKPLSFSGTCGVLRTKVAAASLREAILNFGLEHHLAVVYGDVRDQMETLAALQKFDFLDLDTCR